MKKQLIVRYLIIVFAFSSYPVLGQEISTNAEIYNFELGDVFQYRQSAWWGGGQSGFSRKINDSIVDKYYSLNNDTLFYKIYRIIAEISQWEPYWIYDTSIGTRTVTDLDSLVFDGNIDTVFSSPDIYNGRLINYTEYYLYGGLYKKRWAVGCGQTWIRFDNNTTLDEEEFRLDYYKKGEEEWGEPVVIVGINRKLINRPSIYPNPAKNEFYIDLQPYPNRFQYLKIYSLSGELVQFRHLNQSSFNSVDIHQLRKGVYFVKLISQFETSIFKLIKQ